MPDLITITGFVLAGLVLAWYAAIQYNLDHRQRWSPTALALDIATVITLMALI